MKIELKNIHHAHTLSGSWNAFSANLYIDDIKICTVTDNGFGGGLEYGIIDPLQIDKFNQAFAWCRFQPPVKVYPDMADSIETVALDLDLFLQQIVEKNLVARRKLRC